MAITFKAAQIEQLAVTPGATLYTAPANTTSQVIHALCTNEGAAAVTFTVHVVQSGGAAGDTNIYIDAEPLAPGESTLVSGLTGMILDAGDFITAFGSAATTLNLKIGVKEIV